MKMEASLFSMAELGKACSTNPIFKTPKAWTAISTYLEKSRASPKIRGPVVPMDVTTAQNFAQKRLVNFFLLGSTNS